MLDSLTEDRTSNSFNGTSPSALKHGHGIKVLPKTVCRLWYATLDTKLTITGWESEHKSRKCLQTSHLNALFFHISERSSSSDSLRLCSKPKTPSKKRNTRLQPSYKADGKEESRGEYTSRCARLRLFFKNIYAGGSHRGKPPRGEKLPTLSEGECKKDPMVQNHHIKITISDSSKVSSLAMDHRLRRTCRLSNWEKRIGSEDFPTFFPSLFWTTLGQRVHLLAWR